MSMRGTRKFKEELDTLYNYLVNNPGLSANKLEIRLKEDKFSASAIPAYTCIKWKLHVLEAQERAEYVDESWYALSEHKTLIGVP